MKMFHGSAVASSVLVCVCVCARQGESVSLCLCDSERAYTVYECKKVLYVTVELVSEKQIAPSLNFFEGYYVKFLSERSAQFQEGIIS